jgi:superfamily II DNA or RNA helicase
MTNKGKGTVKVVTGGGKTLLALSVAEKVQNALDKELRLAVVVPTIVLMHQWYDALLEHGNLPAQAIGRLGGGYDEDFENRRVLIAVLTSASKQLPKLVRKAKVGRHLLLIADECHRTGAKEMSEVFKTERRWSLGLSATPEREDEDLDYDASRMGSELGPIIFEFNLADAIRERLVPKFTINHYGLPMTFEERSRYEALSRSITDAMSKLRAQRDEHSDGDFFTWARGVAARNKGELGAVAMRFVSDSSKRRELLTHMRARGAAVETLIRQEFAVNPEARIILFHESIDEVEQLFMRLYKLGFPVIAEHSDLPNAMREEGLEHFRKGRAKIIVSARSLIEGFNVPAVDVGIIVASSGSVRQRIQSLGRMLRRHRGPSGEEKTSCIHVLYATNSSEENIYGKLDWNETTGVDRNRYYHWNVTDEPLAQEGPPKTPLPTETQVDADTLQPGGKYPGQYEGMELSCDSQRNVRDATGRYALDTGLLADAVLQVKGSTGRLRVTPKRNFVLVRISDGEDWETVFVTKLSEPLRFAETSSGASLGDALRWQEIAKPGDPYPFGGLALAEGDIRFKPKSGGIIAKKVRGGELFARRGAKAEDPVKGADAERLIAAIKSLHGKKISKLEWNEALHVYYREGGQLFFICALTKGLEFPCDPTNTQEKQS